MATSVLVPPCYDSSGAIVGCDRTVSDCVDTNGTPCANSPAQNAMEGYSNDGSSVGIAFGSNSDGGLSLTTPSAGGSHPGVSTGLLQSLTQFATSITNSVSGPSNTSLAPGSTRLSTGISSMFSSPIMIVLLAALAFFAFKAFKSR